MYVSPQTTTSVKKKKKSRTIYSLRWPCSWDTKMVIPDIHLLTSHVGHTKGLAAIACISIKLRVQREFIRPHSPVAC